LWQKWKGEYKKKDFGGRSFMPTIEHLEFTHARYRAGPFRKGRLANVSLFVNFLRPQLRAHNLLDAWLASGTTSLFHV
jgi:hypothetical protein